MRGGLPDVPEVLGLTPNADLPIDRRSSERLQEHLRRGILEHPRDVSRGLLEGGARRVDVRGVFRPDVDVHAARVIAGVVGDRASEDGAVRNDQLLVVERAELAGEQIDVLASAGLAVDLDEISDFEWSKDQQHDARRKVPECALKGEADGEAGRGENRCKARRLDSEYPEASENHANEDQVAR